MYAYKYTSPSVSAVFGSKLPEGLYLSNSSGELTYFGSGISYEGVTEQASYDVYWFEVGANGNRSTPIAVAGNVLALGVNAPISIVGTGTYPAISLVMYRLDTLVVDNTPDEWFYSLTNLVPSATISGGAWSADLGSLNIVTKSLTKSYLCPYTPELGWGDYSFSASITDPNGVVTQASNNVVVQATWTPDLYITEYSVNGIDWITDVEPIPEVSGIETIDVRYVEGGVYALDSNGNPVYDELGQIGNIGGVVQTELAVPIGIALNNLYVSNVADSGGNLKDTATFQIARIPNVKYVGPTTFSKEADGLSVTVVDGLLIDSGLASETTSDITFVFADGSYGVYNFPASYTYPGTTSTGSISGGINIFFGEKYMTFIADGQSNMVGYAPVVDIAMPVNARAWDWINRELITIDTTAPATWKNTADPFNGNSQVIYFAKKMAELYPNNIVIFMMNAVGGKAIDQWYNNGWMYSKCITETNRLLTAIGKTSIDGILWTQGEQDDYDGTTLSVYREQRNSVFDSYRSEAFCNPLTPIFTSQLLDIRGAMNPVIEEWDALYEWENNYTPCDKLEYNPDQIHYNNVNAQLIGEANANLYNSFESIKTGLLHEFVLNNYTDINDSAGDRTGTWTASNYYDNTIGFVRASNKDSYILLDQPIVINSGNAFSLSFGISGSALSNASSYFGSDTDSENDMWVWRGSNLMRFELGSGLGNLDFTITAGILDQLTNINQFTIVYDGVSSTALLYINKAAAIQSNTFNKTGAITIQRILSSKIVDFAAAFAPEGGMKYLRVWDRALTDNEITLNRADTQEMVYVSQILSIDGNDVSLGQIPKLNTVEETVAVSWIDPDGITQNDTDPVTLHTNATPVTVTRGSDVATYSHKTGMPIPALLYYRDDSGTRVDFAGDYTVPNTVTSPVTFGWSITNGNVTAEVEQTEFSQVMIIDTANDVIMPAFTDDWGNEATLLSRTQSVVFGTVSGGLYTSPPTQIGNDFVIGNNNPSSIARLTDTRIVFAGSNQLKIFDWDGTDWSQTGNTFSVSGTGPVVGLSSTTFAFANRTAPDEIYAYSFDGTDITQLGNPLALGSIEGTFMCTIGTNRVVVPNNSGGFVVCDFDGTNWTTVGNAYTADGLVRGACCISTSGAFVGALLNGFAYYTFDGTDITRVGNIYNTGSLTEVTISNLLGDDILMFADSHDEWGMFGFDGTDWSNIASPQSVFLDANLPSSCKLSDNGVDSVDVVTIEKYTQPMRTYRFTKA